MRRFRYLHLDVFTDKPFGGNQLAVFPDAVGLSDEEMQALAREINFAETTFVLPPRDPKALARVRIFTPATELPFAGHPTVGTTFALASEGRLQGQGTPILLDLDVGVLDIDLLYEDDRLSFVWMHQPVPTFDAWHGDRARLAVALGLTEDEIAPDLPIERGSAGVPFLYVPVRSLEAIGHARLSADLLDAVKEPSPNIGVYLFTLLTEPTGLRAHARMFAPGMGVPEDAATGSAAGPFGAYLVRHGRLQPDETGEARLRIEQGVEMGRPSAIQVAVEGEDGDIRVVRVGGEAVLVAQGEFLLP